MPKEERQCPRCDAPKMKETIIKLPNIEPVIEIVYQCNASLKKIPTREGFSWLKECEFKINNEFY